MTEGHESDFLVTVRAQVMTRDESTEGWLPLAGGGLANVSIRKRARLSPGAAGHEYIIYGQRISDQSVILSCVINRDLKYYKVMPTFHHWRAGKQRNGLTFQTAADARAFDKGIVRAYNELLDGLAKTNPPMTKYDSLGEDDVFMTLDLPVECDSIQKTHSSPEGSEKSHKSISDRGGGGGVGERYRDTISNKSGDSQRPDRQPSIHYISSEKPYVQQQSTTGALLPLSLAPMTITSTMAGTQTDPSQSVGTSTKQSASTNTCNVITGYTPLQTQSEQPPISLIDAPGTIPPSENYSYVTLTSVHEYNYPVVDQPVAAQMLNVRRESISALKQRNALEAAQALAAVAAGAGTGGGGGGGIVEKSPTPIAGAILKDPQPLNIVEDKNPSIRCRYCNRYYDNNLNYRGACGHAPDYGMIAYKCLSCMCCAECLLYHFTRDSEGNVPSNPCACGTMDTSCKKRWLCLSLLSLICPCLLCYLPMRSCYKLGENCGVCGARHKPPRAPKPEV